MPWFSVLYLFLFAGLGAAGAFDDIRSGRPGWHVLSVIITAGIGCLFVVAFHVERVAEGLGPAVVPLFVFAVGWEIYGMVLDRRDLEAEGKLAATQRRWALAVASLATAPAYILGGILILRRFTGS